MPAKKPKGIIYIVRFDPGRGKYIALDDQGQLLGTDLNANRTIGSARREATLRSRDGVQVTVMIEDQKTGKLKVEYVAIPPK